MAVPCIIGLDSPEHQQLVAALGRTTLCHETLPRIQVQDGQLAVETVDRAFFRPISCVVFHGIFEHDHNTIAGLALWGGPCLPNARAMMDCRLKLPCLVRALPMSRFGAPPRGYASQGAEFDFAGEHVAKWGNWHCGENKLRVQGRTLLEHESIVEPFIPGDAVRVVLIGDHAWQIRLAGNDWLKSIHHDDAVLTEIDPCLLEDTQAVARGFGLEIIANDYIISRDGVPHLLEVNHIPNVTRFPEIWQAYRDYATSWVKEVA